MKKIIIALVAVLTAIFATACPGPGPDLDGVTTAPLVKETYTVEVPENGRVEFAIPDHNPVAGVPLVQTYEADDAKFTHILLSLVPHQMDSRGMVYATADPGRWLVVVVVR